MLITNGIENGMMVILPNRRWASVKLRSVDWLEIFTLYRSGTLKARAGGFSPPRSSRRASTLWSTTEIYCRLPTPKKGRLYTHKIQPPAATCITSSISAKHIGTHHTLIPLILCIIHTISRTFVLWNAEFVHSFCILVLHIMFFGTVWMLLKSLIVWEGWSTTVKTATVRPNSTTLMEYLTLSSWPPEISRKERNFFTTTVTEVKPL